MRPSSGNFPEVLDGGSVFQTATASNTSASGTRRMTPWRGVVLASLLLSEAPMPWACSFAMSREFDVAADPHRQRASRSGPPTIRSVDFVPVLGGGTSCDGAGLLRLENSLPKRESLRKAAHGFQLIPESGMRQPDLLPRFPLSPIRVRRGKATLQWAWTSTEPDPDGHYRWTIRVVSFDREGSMSEPAVLCVATDGSCAEHGSDAPAPEAD